MRVQRPPGAAPVVDGCAEDCRSRTTRSTPRWPCSPTTTGRTTRRGLAELRRVARKRVVLFTWSRAAWASSMCRLPSGVRPAGAARIHLDPCSRPWAAVASSRCRSRTTAGTASWHAYWRRPRAYPGPPVAGIVFRLLEPDEVADAIERLARIWTAASGAPQRRAARLDELDLGYRIVVTELVTGDLRRQQLVLGWPKRASSVPERSRAPRSAPRRSPSFTTTATDFVRPLQEEHRSRRARPCVPGGVGLPLTVMRLTLMRLTARPSGRGAWAWLTGLRSASTPSRSPARAPRGSSCWAAATGPAAPSRRRPCRSAS